MAFPKKTNHKQSKALVNLDDLFSCLEEDTTVQYILAISPDCQKVVKISVANLKAQLATI